MNNFNFVKLEYDDLDVKRKRQSYVEPDDIKLLKGDGASGSKELYQRIRFGDYICDYFGWKDSDEVRVDLYYDEKEKVMMIKERSIGVIKFKIRNGRATSAALARTLHSRMKSEDLFVLEYGQDEDGRYIIIMAREQAAK